MIRKFVSGYRDRNPHDLVAEAVLERFNDLPNWPYYITSFSQSGDKLSQWRSYADDGRGIAIGFCASGYYENEYGTFGVDSGQIIYGDSGLENAVLQLLNRNSSELHTGGALSPDGELRKLTFQLTADSVINEIMDLAIFRKSSGFAEEEEWRWCLSYKFDSQLPNTEIDVPALRDLLKHIQYQFKLRVRYRDGRYGVTPFVELDFSRNKRCVQEIVMGPRVNFALTEPALSYLSEVNGYTVSIRQSAIPYR